MADLIRNAPIGQITRYLTGNKYLQYPEEKTDFECPMCYAQPELAAKKLKEEMRTPSSATAFNRTPTEDVEKADVELHEPSPHDTTSSGLDREALSRAETAYSLPIDQDLSRTLSSADLARTASKHSLVASRTQDDLQRAWTTASQARNLAKEPSRPIIPTRMSDGTVFVDWYTTDDAENPQNWSSGKKFFAGLQIYLYTLAVYMGSAIYTPSEGGMMKEFGVGNEAASLGLSLYVLAYGIGPLIFSPMSEVPVIGRNPPYMVAMAIFVILCVPTALAPSFTGFLVLRFLQGFFGSPCLATDGASLGDMYSLIKLPYVLCLWSFAATCGPALGPVISGFSVPAKGWRWSMWEILWLSGPVFIMMMFFLPETSSSNILLRRAQRLRKLTGDSRLRAQSEIDQANMNAKDLAFDALVRPMQLMVQDPAISFTAGYVALCYGIYYSFFEAFPLVYIDKYGFTIGKMGLTFLSVTVGTILAIIIYYAYIYYVVEPQIVKQGLGAPERRLIPALPAAFFLPAGQFIFGWTGNGDVHWIVSVIGIMLFTMGVFVLIQSVFVYLPLSYPQYAASLFAGNDFARSCIAFAAIMFSRPMYINLGIGPGTSLLGGLTAGCIAGIFVLYFYGAKLRARSKFSAK